MKNIFTTSALALIFSVALAACGGGGGGGGGSAPAPTSSSSSSSSADSSSSSSGSSGSSSSGASQAALTGKFVDAVVDGLKYQTATQSGVTDGNGEFKYLPGESVTFTLFDTVLDAGAAAAIMTPAELKTMPDINYIVNLLRVLQAADVDGNPYNGIEIPTVPEGEHWNFDLNKSIRDFEVDPTFLAFVAKYSVSKTPVTIQSALNHFNSTVNSSIAPLNAIDMNGKSMKYSVKSSFCPNPDTWYGDAVLSFSGLTYTMKGSWANITNMAGFTSGSNALQTGITCFNSTAVNNTFNLSYEYAGNIRILDIFNSQVSAGATTGLVQNRLDYHTAAPREFISIFWRTPGTNVLYYSRTYVTAGTLGKGTFTERYEIQ